MQRLSPHISRREWRKVVLFAVVIIIITILPYVIGYLKQGNGWSFSGFLFGVEDGNSYIGKMRLGARGLLDFYLFYTPEPHAAAPLVFLPYIIPGWIVGRFVGDHDPALFQVLTLVYHLMQMVFNLLLIVVLYRFIAVFIRSPKTRFLALVLATLGGGFGWLLTLMGQSNWLGTPPPEFFIPEGFSWLILLGLPHLALARAALLGGFMLMIQSPVISRQSSAKEENSRKLEAARLKTDGNSAIGIRYAVLAGICWLVVGLAVPFYLAIIYVILALWGLVLWLVKRRFPREFVMAGGIAAGLTLPLFAYYSYTFAVNPIFAVWSSQNILQSPNPLHYVAAYGLLVAFALVGGRWAWRKITGSSPHYALLLWPVVVPILVYLPMNVQRRMAEAVIVPLAILAAVGLRFMTRRPVWKRLYRPAVVVLCLSSVLFVVGITFGALGQARPLFRPTAELAALDWLNNHAPADSVVLTAFDTGTQSPKNDIDTGNLIPAYTNLRPYVGHGPETVHSPEKDAITRRFFADDMSAGERRDLYASVNIRYIFYDPMEQTLFTNQAGIPAWQADAEKIYDVEGYQVWQVR